MRSCYFLVLVTGALFFISSSSGMAKHLVGGSLTYDFLGTTPSGDHEYRIELSIYRDAQPPTTPFDPQVYIGVYEDDVILDRNRFISIPYDSQEKKVSIPSGGNNCSFTPNVDFRLNNYVDTIALPPSSDGYHLAYPRCCRNNPINLVSDMGQYFYAYIPPTQQKNTSPDFNAVPSPYICVGDTTTISYQTFDPDGDSLVYKLADPYTGGNRQEPNPGPPQNLPLPLNNVTFKTGYSVGQPFGAGGMARINASSGVATFSANTKGRYVIAVEIQEFRNGKLISRIRRDVQILVIDCPPNSPPANTTPKDSAQRTYDVIKGNTLRFTADFTDSNEMSLGASGGLFEDIRRPRPQLSSQQSGDTLKVTFNWQSQCYHGKQQPYVFNFKIADKGCPPKETISGYRIDVIGYPGASISGPDSACQNAQVTYQANIGKTGSDSVTWQIPGGHITGDPTAENIEVVWDSSGRFTMSAITANVNGCDPDTATYKVRVFKPPYGAAGPDVTVCGGDTIRLGPDALPEATDYQWSSPDVTGKSDTGNPLYVRPNTSGSIVKTTLLPEVEQYACNIRDTVKLTIQPQPVITAIQGDSTPCIGEQITYRAQSPGAFQYQWSASGGLASVASDTAAITWTAPDRGEVAATAVNQYGCISDTATKPINIINPAIDTILGTEVVCPNSSRIRYWVDSNQQNTYQWQVGRGTVAEGQGNGQARINWGDSGRGYVEVKELTPQGCFSDPFRLPVQIAYRLETSPIFGDTFICEQSEQSYQVRYTNGSTYQWWSRNGQGSPQDPENRINVKWGEAGTGQLRVLETSYDSVNDKVCRGDTIRQEVVLNPLPAPGPIQGPDSICSEDTGVYYVNGFDSSRFSWAYPNDKARAIRQSADSLFLYFKNNGTINLQLQEITKDSCLSPVKQLQVWIRSRPQPKAIQGEDSVCQSSGLSIPYHYPGREGSRFQWQAAGGAIQSGEGQDTVSVAWNAHGKNQLTVYEVAANGCKSKPVTKPVTVDRLTPFIDRVTTLPDKPDKLKVEWSLSNESFFRARQRIRRKHGGSTGWQTAAQSLPPGARSYDDPEARAQNQAYTYQLITTNLCRDAVRTKPHRAMLLEGDKQGERSLMLNWTSYQGWERGVARYEVLRREPPGEQAPDYQVVERLSGKQDSLFIESPTAGATQCYRIKAISKDGKPVISWSNEQCMDFPAYVYIPNAFSPYDANGLNDTFRVTTANLKSFKLEVYNRWGAKLYATTDPEEGWDGSYNGELAPSGTYVVKVQFRGNGATQERTATLHLLR